MGDSKRKCTNSAGSFKCEDCDAGYVNDGAKGCKDIDECAKNNGGCHSARKCTNSVGSFKCGDCDTGYAKFGDTKCRRMNPCKDTGRLCDSDNRGGCKEIEATVNQVCDVDDGEVWNKEVDADSFEDCKKSCMASNYCLSVTYYNHGGCSHWSSMCKKYVPREKVRSKNVKGESLNKKECDAGNGEVWEGKLKYWVSVDQCRATCMSREECNSFSTCCTATRIVENAHSERWRLPL